MSNEYVTELFDENGNIIGALLTAEAWASVKQRFGAELGLAPAAGPDRKEPLGEWDTLVEYWDFPYPVDTDVRCSLCGNESANWLEDDPRKFRLSSCNIGGLVTFRCQQCKAKITKKHFKDQITVEVAPFEPEKNATLEAKYDPK